MMEKNKKLEELLAESFSVQHLNLQPPSLSEATRRRVASYKKQEQRDIFSLFASFLNLRVRLVHAFILTVFIWMGALLIGDGDRTVNKQMSSSQEVSNMAAVRNSTVMSSIQTFVLHQ